MQIKIFQAGLNLKERKHTISEIDSIAKAKKLDKSLSYFQLIKALQFNDDFTNEIKRIRKKYNIPINGMECKKTALESLNEYSLTEDVKETPLNSLLDDLENEAYYLMKYFKYKNKNNFYEIMIRAVARIILFSGVLLYDYPNINIKKENVKYGNFVIPEILISIEINTSKRQIINFIDDNWENIQEMQKDLKKELKFKISQRDLEVLELEKHNNTKLINTIKELDKIYPNNDFNYDQIKASHKNAKDKIKSLFKKSKNVK